MAQTKSFPEPWGLYTLSQLCAHVKIVAGWRGIQRNSPGIDGERNMTSVCRPISHDSLFLRQPKLLHYATEDRPTLPKIGFALQVQVTVELARID